MKCFFYISCRQVQFMRVIIPVLCQTTSKLQSEYTLLKVHFSYKRDRNVFKWLKTQVQTQTSNHMCLLPTSHNRTRKLGVAIHKHQLLSFYRKMVTKYSFRSLVRTKISQNETDLALLLNGFQAINYCVEHSQN